MTKALELTTDPLECQILLADRTEPLDPDDSYDKDTHHLLRRLSAAQNQLRPHHREWGRLFLSGMIFTKIADKAGVTSSAITAAFKKPAMADYLNFLGQLQRKQGGPALAARRDMLWRIAKREEHDNPRVSLQALDILNRGEGLYVRDDHVGEGQINVTINQLTLPQPPPRPTTGQVIEGEFTPGIVET